MEEMEEIKIIGNMETTTHPLNTAYMLLVNWLQSIEPKHPINEEDQIKLLIPESDNGIRMALNKIYKYDCTDEICTESCLLYVQQKWVTDKRIKNIVCPCDFLWTVWRYSKCRKDINLKSSRHFDQMDAKYKRLNNTKRK